MRTSRDYRRRLLKPGALKGVRIARAPPRHARGDLEAGYDAALAVLKAQGAVLVDVEQPKLDGLGDAEFEVLKTELKADLDAYLATTPAAVKTRTLDRSDRLRRGEQGDARCPFSGRRSFIDAAKTNGLADPEYLGARAKSLRLAGRRGDRRDAEGGRRDAAGRADLRPGVAERYRCTGDHFDGPSASELPAIAGYPASHRADGAGQGAAGRAVVHRDRPMAMQAVLDAGYAYEQASHARVAAALSAHRGRRTRHGRRAA